MHEIEHRDRELLNVLQTELPIASTPYALVGQTIDMSEKEVIKRIARMKTQGVIRRLSGLFDSRRLGYRTCLVAARVQADDVDRAAATINLHPGVFQNYLRNHEYNLWFTIAIAPDSLLGLEETARILGEQAHCQVVRLFPTLRLLKTATGEGDHHGESEGDEEAHEDLPTPSAPEIEAVRLLQRDLPLQPRPFDELAGQAVDVSAEELLETAREFVRRQQLRKIAAVVDVKRPAFSASTMGVWKVPADQLEAFQTALAAEKAISQAYLRPVYDDWPYNVFTTVHGRSVDECEAVLTELENTTGITERDALYPTRELKKVRISLFSPEQRAWEESRSAERSASAAS